MSVQQQAQQVRFVRTESLGTPQVVQGEQSDRSGYGYSGHEGVPAVGRFTEVLKLLRGLFGRRDGFREWAKVERVAWYEGDRLDPEALKWKLGGDYGPFLR